MLCVLTLICSGLTVSAEDLGVPVESTIQDEGSTIEPSDEELEDNTTVSGNEIEGVPATDTVEQTEEDSEVKQDDTSNIEDAEVEQNDMPNIDDTTNSEEVEDTKTDEETIVEEIPESKEPAVEDNEVEEDKEDVGSLDLNETEQQDTEKPNTEEVEQSELEEVSDEEVSSIENIDELGTVSGNTVDEIVDDEYGIEPYEAKPENPIVYQVYKSGNNIVIKANNTSNIPVYSHTISLEFIPENNAVYQRVNLNIPNLYSGKVYSTSRALTSLWNMNYRYWTVVLTDQYGYKYAYTIPVKTSDKDDNSVVLGLHQYTNNRIEVQYANHSKVTKDYKFVMNYDSSMGQIFDDTGSLVESGATIDYGTIDSGKILRKYFSFEPNWDAYGDFVVTAQPVSDGALAKLTIHLIGDKDIQVSLEDRNSKLLIFLQNIGEKLLYDCEYHLEYDSSVVSITVPDGYLNIIGIPPRATVQRSVIYTWKDSSVSSTEVILTDRDGNALGSIILQNPIVPEYEYTVIKELYMADGTKAATIGTIPKKAELGTKIPYTATDEITYEIDNKLITFYLYKVMNENGIITDNPDNNVVTIIYREKVESWLTVRYNLGYRDAPLYDVKKLKDGDDTPSFADANPDPSYIDSTGNPVRPGYEFKGWAPAVAPIVHADTADENGYITYTATWLRITKPSYPYTVIKKYYDKDGNILDTSYNYQQGELDSEIPYDAPEEESISIDGVDRDFYLDEIINENGVITADVDANIVTIIYREKSEVIQSFIYSVDYVYKDLSAQTIDTISEVEEAQVGEEIPFEEDRIIHKDRLYSHNSTDAKSIIVTENNDDNHVTVTYTRDVPVSKLAYLVRYHYLNSVGDEVKLDMEYASADKDTLIPVSKSDRFYNNLLFKFQRVEGEGKVVTEKESDNIVDVYLVTAEEDVPVQYKVVYIYTDADGNVSSTEQSGSATVGDDIKYDVNRTFYEGKLYKFDRIEGATKVTEKISDNVLYVYFNQDRKPETPNVPVEPNKPDTPNKPETPDTPSKPYEPETPNKPSTPNKPDKPNPPSVSNNNIGDTPEQTTPSEPSKQHKPTAITEERKNLVSIPDEGVPLSGSIPQTGDDLGGIIANTIISGLAMIIALFIALSNRRKKS